jgi:hypothetical protein
MAAARDAGSVLQLFLVRLSVARADLRHLRDDDERVGADQPTEQVAGAILVDDGVDTLEVALGIADHRHAAAADGDREHAARHQRADGLPLHDLDRLRAGHHAPPAASRVLHHRPAVLQAQALGLFLGVERADGLGRLRHRRVVRSTRTCVTTEATGWLSPRRRSAFCSACCSMNPRPPWLSAPHTNMGMAGCRARTCRRHCAARCCRPPGRCRAS